MLFKAARVNELCRGGEKRALVETMRISNAQRSLRQQGPQNRSKEGSLLGSMLLVGLGCTGLKEEEGRCMDVGFSIMASGVLRGVPEMKGSRGWEGEHRLPCHSSNPLRHKGMLTGGGLAWVGHRLFL